MRCQLIGRVFLIVCKQYYLLHFPWWIVLLKILKLWIVSTLDDIQYSEDMTVSWKDNSFLTSQLECGKSAGHDGLCAEAIKLAHNRIPILLSLLFTLCLSHGYLPPAMIETTFVLLLQISVAILQITTIVDLLP